MGYSGVEQEISGSQAVLVDSGADANFMDRGLAEKLKLDLSSLPKPLQATALDGRERSQMDSVPNASSPSCTSVLSDPGANAPASDSPAPASSDHSTPPGSVRGSVRGPVPTAGVLSDAVLQTKKRCSPLGACRNAEAPF
ncbi:unnamed protein product [Merluccius merluccius]